MSALACICSIYILSCVALIHNSAAFSGEPWPISRSAASSERIILVFDVNEDHLQENKMKVWHSFVFGPSMITKLYPKQGTSLSVAVVNN